ncbi:MAG: hypothetical protein WAO12_03980, partial [Venatoribacter sp.]
AAAEQGVEIYLGCDNGLCMICQSERIAGTFRFRNSLGQSVLGSEDRVLCCIATPLTDAELYMPSVFAADHIEPVSYACQIPVLEKLGATMWRAVLLLPAGEKVSYWAGQHLFLQVQHADGSEEQVPFSIANAPAAVTGGNPREIELLIANHSDNAQSIINFLAQAVVVHATLPMGECFVNQRFLSEHYGEPLLMVAAGSGFSQIKCLTEAVLTLSPKHEIHLYWSNKSADEFFLTELLAKWQSSHPNLKVNLILEEATSGWSGRSGWLYQIIQQDFPNLKHVQMFACGSANMVYGTLDELTTNGLSISNMHSDTFTYAPRA